MKMNKRLTAVALMTVALLLGEGRAPGKPTPSAADIVVTRTKDTGAGVEWNVTLPKAMAGRLQDQAWLVVDGQSEGIAGYDVPPADFPGASHGPLRLHVSISNNLDGQMKDVLKAQGLPVKPDVTVYHISYGVNLPGQCTMPKTLHFRHSAAALVYEYGSLPTTARYKVGDRITLMDAVALDSTALGPDSLVLGDGRNRLKPGLTTDMAHHIMIQVQFLRVGPDGKLVTKVASR